MIIIVKNIFAFLDHYADTQLVICAQKINPIR